MSRYYQRKGAGRKNGVEVKLEKTIDELIEKHDLDASEIKVCTSQEELQDLRDELMEKYSSDKQDDLEEDDDDVDPEESEPSSEEKKSSEEQSSQTSSVNAKETDANSETVSLDKVGLGDFIETETKNPFDLPFNPEDLFKIDPTGQNGASTPGAGEQELPSTPAPATARPAWEVKKEMEAKLGTSEKIAALEGDSIAEPSAPASKPTAPLEEKKELTEEEERKVKLAKSTSKKATKSLARQSAKIFEFILEFGVKKFSKISDRFLTKLEAGGEVDRHTPIDDSGKTIAQYVDDHNDRIDEIIKVDPDDRDDLIEAIMLVAEEEDLKASPKANLGMVVITMALTMAKAGYDEKKQIKKLIKQGADNYVVGVKRLDEANREIAELKKQLSFKNSASSQERQFDIQPPSPTNPVMRKMTFEKQNDVPQKPSITFGTPEHNPMKEKHFAGASNMLEVVDSEIIGDKEARESAQREKT